MRVRIRLQQGPPVTNAKRKNRHLAMAFGALLTPIALVCGVVAAWKIGADLGLAGEFSIRGGLFSHWQIWMSGAILFQVAAIVLTRYGQPPASESAKSARQGQS